MIERHSISCKDFEIIIEYNHTNNVMTLNNPFIKKSLIGDFIFKCKETNLEISSRNYCNIEHAGLYLRGRHHSSKDNCIRATGLNEWSNYKKAFLNLKKKYKPSKSHLPEWW
jgi:hypothetical protein